MRNKFLFLCLFLVGSLTACKDTKWVDVPTGTPPEGSITGKPGEPEPEIPAETVLVNSSYISGNAYEQGRISVESMASCNDLIYFSARPYDNGELAFDLPINDAILKNVTYVATWGGRQGVAQFAGTSSMNGGDGLLHGAEPEFPSKSFTFGTYIYISEWVDGAYLFKKESGGSILAALKMTTQTGSFEFSIGTSKVTATNPALTIGRWHYVSLEYKAAKALLYVDNNTSVVEFVGSLPESVPATRADFVIGDKFKGYLDETMVSSQPLNTWGRNEITFDNWTATQVLAYWKYNDSNVLGKDSHTWLGCLATIRKDLEKFPSTTRKMRLGLASGGWKVMIANPANRTKFANEVKKTLDTYGFDGVDIDFEWPTTTAMFEDYSTTILLLREVLGRDVCLTASLHPTSYKISQEAIAAINYTTFQCYGPAPMRFPFAQFVQDGKDAIAWGFPKEKLVMGVPYYGTIGNGMTTVSYSDFIKAGLTDPALDTFSYAVGGVTNTYTFNGQNTIRQKATYVCENGFGGIMSWSLGSDLSVTNPLSLQRVVSEVLDAHAKPIK